MRAETIGPPEVAPRDEEAHARDLLRRIAAGDRSALEQLYLAHHRRLARFLVRMTGRYEMAEEVINDTFFIVWQSAARFRCESAVATWLTGIAYRRALRTLRSARRGEVGLEALDEVAIELEDGEELRDLVERALAHLSVDHRVTLELAYFLGHSCAEIAAITGCPVNTVKTRLHYARESLRVLLPRLGGDPGAMR
jgi:RNA polymerase sigma-70 factor (ECF subfamily)